MSEVVLRGIAWDHPRGIGAVAATAAAFEATPSGFKVEWVPQSLAGFGFTPLESLCREFDLLLIDHPHVGELAASHLVALDEHLPTDFLADQDANSVGPSHRSYRYREHQWALAVDAAAQVAVYRPDLLTDVPRSWSDVFALADALPPHSIGLPMCWIDSFCNLLTICANSSGNAFYSPDGGFDRYVLESALETLDALTRVVHPGSLSLDPPRTLDMMASGDEIVYVPLLFGYVNYAQTGFRPHQLRFGAIPSAGEQPTGSLLGGAGLAVSANSQQREAAIAYAAFVASSDVQRGAYLDGGGQPGHRSAWLDGRANSLSGNFFADTLETLDRAYLRPRLAEAPHFIDAQAEIGRILAAAVECGDRLTGLAGAIVDCERTFAKASDDGVTHAAVE